MAKKELQKNFEECWCYKDLTVLQRATIKGLIEQEREEGRREAMREIAQWIEESWWIYYDSSKPLADFKKQLLRNLTIN